ncbi:type II toxin-antitoxin system HicB family antitoxin [Erwinia sp. MYb375]|uniref:type II toxin-antitoxin system HicB family antitoxin n=1 Tax=unclassified Erwinia TaxID=2622719 RepID=UPI0030AFBEEF
MNKVMAIPNVMVIGGQPAAVNFVAELDAFRGKFLGLSGYCDFVADSITGLKCEGEISLRDYLADCHESGIDPYEHEEKVKTFTLRYPESFGEQLAQAAAEHQLSLNSYIVAALSAQMKKC